MTNMRQNDGSVIIAILIYDWLLSYRATHMEQKRRPNTYPNKTMCADYLDESFNVMVPTEGIHARCIKCRFTNINDDAYADTATNDDDEHDRIIHTGPSQTQPTHIYMCQNAYILLDPKIYIHSAL